MSWVYLLRDRSKVVTTVTHFITEVVTQYSTTPKILRTNNALELVQASLLTFCADRGIIHQTTCPHTSQQNGIAERKHRQFLDITRTLRIEMCVPSYLWSDTLMIATYLQNRLPSASLGGAITLHRLSPTSSLFSLPPQVLGCVAFVQDHSPSLSKLSPRALKGVFVGYSRTQKGYRLYFPYTHRYMTSADVTFHEDSPFFSPPSPSPTPTVASPPPSFPPLVVIADPCPSISPPPLFQSSPSPPISSVQPVSSPPYTNPLSPTSTVTSPSPVVIPPAPPNDLHLPIALRKGTRACTQHPISHFVSYDRLSPSFRAFALLVASKLIPQSHVEAAQVREWKAVMDHEVEVLVSRGTWTLVPRPADVNIVTCKWVFTIKYHLDGTIARHKARPVAHGFTQAYGIDHTETFLPIVRLNSVHVLLFLAINQAWSLHQLDVCNVFLYGDLEEQVFMEQPPGYVAQGESSKVCFL